MRALTWQGRRDVRVEDVPDPRIEQPTDAVIKVTTTCICGSDLHLYETLGPFLDPGDVLGHEAMGIVEEVGSAVTQLRRGDRIVVPFNISCGHCAMCDLQLYSQCETTQVRAEGKGAALFGYTKLYGQVPGGQAEYLRVPQAQFTHVVVPEGLPDDRFVYLSDVLPTAWQAVAYADTPKGGTLCVLGLGPIGDMCTRIATLHGVRVIGVDLVPERLERAASRGTEIVDLRDHEADLTDVMRDLTGGRGPDAVVDAVGMEAHGSPGVKALHGLVAHMPGAVAAPLMKHAGTDRLAALYAAIDMVRRGGTISLSGVYGGMSDPLPLMVMFDKQVQLRMGQANVKRWVPEIMPLLLDDADPLGVDAFATHRVSLEEAPQAYERFQKKQDGVVKVQLKP